MSEVLTVGGFATVAVITSLIRRHLQLAEASNVAATRVAEFPDPKDPRSWVSAGSLSKIRFPPAYYEKIAELDRRALDDADEDDIRDLRSQQYLRALSLRNAAIRAAHREAAAILAASLPDSASNSASVSSLNSVRVASAPAIRAAVARATAIALELEPPVAEGLPVPTTAAEEAAEEEELEVELAARRARVVAARTHRRVVLAARSSASDASSLRNAVASQGEMRIVRAAEAAEKEAAREQAQQQAMFGGGPPPPEDEDAPEIDEQTLAEIEAGAFGINLTSQLSSEASDLDAALIAATLSPPRVRSRWAGVRSSFGPAAGEVKIIAARVLRNLREHAAKERELKESSGATAKEVDASKIRAIAAVEALVDKIEDDSVEPKADEPDASPDLVTEEPPSSPVKLPACLSPEARRAAYLAAVRSLGEQWRKQSEHYTLAEYFRDVTDAIVDEEQRARARLELGLTVRSDGSAQLAEGGRFRRLPALKPVSQSATDAASVAVPRSQAEYLRLLGAAEPATGSGALTINEYAGLSLEDRAAYRARRAVAVAAETLREAKAIDAAKAKNISGSCKDESQSDSELDALATAFCPVASTVAAALARPAMMTTDDDQFAISAACACVSSIASSSSDDLLAEMISTLLSSDMTVLDAVPAVSRIAAARCLIRTVSPLTSLTAALSEDMDCTASSPVRRLLLAWRLLDISSSGVSSLSSEAVTHFAIIRARIACLAADPVHAAEAFWSVYVSSFRARLFSREIKRSLLPIAVYLGAWDAVRVLGTCLDTAAPEKKDDSEVEDVPFEGGDLGVGDVPLLVRLSAHFTPADWGVASSLEASEPYQLLPPEAAATAGAAPHVQAHAWVAGTAEEAAVLSRADAANPDVGKRPAVVDSLVLEVEAARRLCHARARALGVPESGVWSSEMEEEVRAALAAKVVFVHARAQARSAASAADAAETKEAVCILEQALPKENVSDVSEPTSVIETEASSMDVLGPATANLPILSVSAHVAAQLVGSVNALRAGLRALTGDAEAAASDTGDSVHVDESSTPAGPASAAGTEPAAGAAAVSTLTSDTSSYIDVAAEATAAEVTPADGSNDLGTDAEAPAAVPSSASAPALISSSPTRPSLRRDHAPAVPDAFRSLTLEDLDSIRAASETGVSSAANQVSVSGSLPLEPVLRVIAAGKAPSVVAPMSLPEPLYARLPGCSEEVVTSRVEAIKAAAAKWVTAASVVSAACSAADAAGVPLVSSPSQHGPVRPLTMGQIRRLERWAARRRISSQGEDAVVNAVVGAVRAHAAAAATAGASSAILASLAPVADGAFSPRRPARSASSPTMDDDEASVSPSAPRELVAAESEGEIATAVRAGLADSAEAATAANPLTRAGVPANVTIVSITALALGLIVAAAAPVRPNEDSGAEWKPFDAAVAAAVELGETLEDVSAAAEWIASLSEDAAAPVVEVTAAPSLKARSEAVSAALASVQVAVAAEPAAVAAARRARARALLPAASDLAFENEFFAGDFFTEKRVAAAKAAIAAAGHATEPDEMSDEEKLARVLEFFFPGLVSPHSAKKDAVSDAGVDVLTDSQAHADETVDDTPEEDKAAKDGNKDESKEEEKNAEETAAVAELKAAAAAAEKAWAASSPPATGTAAATAPTWVTPRRIVALLRDPAAARGLAGRDASAWADGALRGLAASPELARAVAALAALPASEAFNADTSDLDDDAEDDHTAERALIEAETVALAIVSAIGVPAAAGPLYPSEKTVAADEVAGETSVDGPYDAVTVSAPAIVAALGAARIASAPASASLRAVFSSLAGRGPGSDSTDVITGEDAIVSLAPAARAATAALRTVVSAAAAQARDRVASANLRRARTRHETATEGLKSARAAEQDAIKEARARRWRSASGVAARTDPAAGAALVSALHWKPSSPPSAAEMASVPVLARPARAVDGGAIVYGADGGCWAADGSVGVTPTGRIVFPEPATSTEQTVISEENPDAESGDAQPGESASSEDKPVESVDDVSEKPSTDEVPIGLTRAEFKAALSRAVLLAAETAEASALAAEAAAEAADVVDVRFDFRVSSGDDAGDDDKVAVIITPKVAAAPKKSVHHDSEEVYVSLAPAPTTADPLAVSLIIAPSKAPASDKDAFAAAAADARSLLTVGGDPDWAVLAAAAVSAKAALTSTDPQSALDAVARTRAYVGAACGNRLASAAVLSAATVSRAVKSPEIPDAPKAGRGRTLPALCNLPSIVAAVASASAFADRAASLADASRDRDVLMAKVDTEVAIEAASRAAAAEVAAEAKAKEAAEALKTASAAESKAAGSEAADDVADTVVEDVTPEENEGDARTDVGDAVKAAVGDVPGFWTRVRKCAGTEVSDEVLAVVAARELSILTAAATATSSSGVTPAEAAIPVSVLACALEANEKSPVARHWSKAWSLLGCPIPSPSVPASVTALLSNALAIPARAAPTAAAAAVARAAFDATNSFRRVSTNSTVSDSVVVPVREWASAHAAALWRAAAAFTAPTGARCGSDPSQCLAATVALLCNDLRPRARAADAATSASFASGAAGAVAAATAARAEAAGARAGETAALRALHQAREFAASLGKGVAAADVTEVATADNAVGLASVAAAANAVGLGEKSDRALSVTEGVAAVAPLGSLLAEPTNCVAVAISSEDIAHRDWVGAAGVVARGAAVLVDGWSMIGVADAVSSAASEGVSKARARSEATTAAAAAAGAAGAPASDSVSAASTTAKPAANKWGLSANAYESLLASFNTPKSEPAVSKPADSASVAPIAEGSSSRIVTASWPAPVAARRRAGFPPLPPLEHAAKLGDNVSADAAPVSRPATILSVIAASAAAHAESENATADSRARADVLTMAARAIARARAPVAPVVAASTAGSSVNDVVLTAMSDSLDSDDEDDSASVVTMSKGDVTVEIIEDPPVEEEDITLCFFANTEGDVRVHLSLSTPSSLRASVDAAVAESASVPGSLGPLALSRSAAARLPAALVGEDGVTTVLAAPASCRVSSKKADVQPSVAAQLSVAKTFGLVPVITALPSDGDADAPAVLVRLFDPRPAAAAAAAALSTAVDAGQISGDAVTEAKEVLRRRLADAAMSLPKSSVGGAKSVPAIIYQGSLVADKVSADTDSAESLVSESDEAPGADVKANEEPETPSGLEDAEVSADAAVEVEAVEAERIATDDTTEEVPASADASSEKEPEASEASEAATSEETEAASTETTSDPELLLLSSLGYPIEDKDALTSAFAPVDVTSLFSVADSLPVLNAKMTPAALATACAPAPDTVTALTTGRTHFTAGGALAFAFTAALRDAADLAPRLRARAAAGAVSTKATETYAAAAAAGEVYARVHSEVLNSWLDAAAEAAETAPASDSDYKVAQTLPAPLPPTLSAALATASIAAAAAVAALAAGSSDEAGDYARAHAEHWATAHGDALGRRGWGRAARILAETLAPAVRRAGGRVKGGRAASASASAATGSPAASPAAGAEVGEEEDDEKDEVVVSPVTPISCEWASALLTLSQSFGLPSLALSASTPGPAACACAAVVGDHMTSLLGPLAAVAALSSTAAAEADLAASKAAAKSKARVPHAELLRRSLARMTPSTAAAALASVLGVAAPPLGAGVAAPTAASVSTAAFPASALSAVASAAAEEIAAAAVAAKAESAAAHRAGRAMPESASTLSPATPVRRLRAPSSADDEELMSPALHLAFSARSAESDGDDVVGAAPDSSSTTTSAADGPQIAAAGDEETHSSLKSVPASPVAVPSAIEMIDDVIAAIGLSLPTATAPAASAAPAETEEVKPSAARSIPAAALSSLPAAAAARAAAAALRAFPTKPAAGSPLITAYSLTRALGEEPSSEESKDEEPAAILSRPEFLFAPRFTHVQTAEKLAIIRAGPAAAAAAATAAGIAAAPGLVLRRCARTRPAGSSSTVADSATASVCPFAAVAALPSDGVHPSMAPAAAGVTPSTGAIYAPTPAAGPGLCAAASAVTAARLPRARTRITVASTTAPVLRPAETIVRPFTGAEATSPAAAAAEAEAAAALAAWLSCAVYPARESEFVRAGAVVNGRSLSALPLMATGFASASFPTIPAASASSLASAASAESLELLSWGRITRGAAERAFAAAAAATAGTEGHTGAAGGDELAMALARSLWSSATSSGNAADRAEALLSLLFPVGSDVLEVTERLTLSPSAAPAAAEKESDKKTGEESESKQDAAAVSVPVSGSVVLRLVSLRARDTPSTTAPVLGTAEQLGAVATVPTQEPWALAAPAPLRGTRLIAAASFTVEATAAPARIPQAALAPEVTLPVARAAVPSAATDIAGPKAAAMASSLIRTRLWSRPSAAPVAAAASAGPDASRWASLFRNGPAPSTVPSATADAGGEADVAAAGAHGAFASADSCSCPCACLCECKSSSTTDVEEAKDEAGEQLTSAEIAAASELSALEADTSLYAEAMRSGVAVASALASVAQTPADWRRLMRGHELVAVVRPPAPAPGAAAPASVPTGPEHAAALHRALAPALARAREAGAVLPADDDLVIIAGDPAILSATNDAPAPRGPPGAAFAAASAARGRERLFVFRALAPAVRLAQAVDELFDAVAVVPISGNGPRVSRIVASSRRKRAEERARLHEARVSLEEARATVELATERAHEAAQRSRGGTVLGRRGKSAPSADTTSAEAVVAATGALLEAEADVRRAGGHVKQPTRFYWDKQAAFVSKEERLRARIRSATLREDDGSVPLNAGIADKTVAFIKNLFMKI